MAYGRSGLRQTLNDYKNVRTIPASISAAFVVTSLFLFGGMGTVELVWFSYTLTPQHAAIGTIAAYGVAFMSSATDDFGQYETWEQGLILAGPSASLGWHFVPVIKDTFLMLGDPLGAQAAFLITLFSWAATAR